MGLTDILNTARDALQTQQFGLGVTSQNIANVNTPGYARREAMLETQAFGGRSFGSVKAAGLRQVVDQATERRYFSTMGLSAAANQRDGDLARIESVFSDLEGGGINDSMQKLFASFSALASNPSDPTARTTVLARADAFAQTLSGAADELASFKLDQLANAKMVTTQINEKAGHIAKLNGEIQNAKSQGQDAADLIDQRTQVVTDLSGLVDVHSFVDDKGGLVIQSTGTTLVEGTVARTLAIGLDTGGKMQVLASRQGGPATDVSAFLTGGKLAGIRDSRDVDGDAVQTQLDQLAFDVANAVNTQHAAGFGLDGSTGQNLFHVSGSVLGAARSLSVDANIVGRPDKLAASATAAGIPGNSANAVALGQLADTAIASGGTRTPVQAYSDIVGDVGLRKQGARMEAETREGILSQVTTTRESASGVNLDEEMVNLTKYQRAYEASAKVLATVDQLFAELMESLRR